MILIYDSDGHNSDILPLWLLFITLAPNVMKRWGFDIHQEGLMTQNMKSKEYVNI